MQTWTPTTHKCKRCGSENTLRLMASIDECKLCRNERVEDVRQHLRSGKMCPECDMMRNHSSFRQNDEVCEFCADGTRCSTCGNRCLRSTTVNGLCEPCQQLMAEVLDKQQRETRPQCTKCQGLFDQIEMLDEHCVYCSVSSRNKKRVMQVAEKMKNDSILYRRVTKYIYSCRRAVNCSK